ncbi:DUF429 domain-containing protein [Vibrio profundum]
MNYVGIDGCKAGWVAWALKDEQPKLYISACLEELAERVGPQGHWLIDMPIGFSTPEQPDRLCDKAARAILKERRSSVFTVPCREAVYCESYEQACEINVQRLGKKFSKQTWGIVPKMREVDAFVRCHVIQSTLKVRESHPEVVFTGLAGRPMSFNKKTTQGRDERLAVLKYYAPQWFEGLLLEMARVPRKVAELDDLIDAFVLMLSAIRWDELISLPTNSASFESDFSREIVYIHANEPVGLQSAIPLSSHSKATTKPRKNADKKLSWPQLLAYLQSQVSYGNVTTYKQLSEHFYGHPSATQAIISMLKAAVADDDSNATWTNRVVGASGNVVDVNGQKSQLIAEGLPMKNDKVILGKGTKAHNL